MFAQVAKITNTPYRVYFKSKEEMAKWLEARQWTERVEEDFSLDEDVWIRDEKEYFTVMTLRSREIFDDGGRLRAMLPDQWDGEWIQVHREKKKERNKKAPGGYDDLDDEIPF